MPKSASTQIAVIGIDIGKNSFHVAGRNKLGSIVLRQKWSRGQMRRGLPTHPVSSAWRYGAHHLARKLAALAHDITIDPATIR